MPGPAIVVVHVLLLEVVDRGGEHQIVADWLVLHASFVLLAGGRLERLAIEQRADAGRLERGRVADVGRDAGVEIVDRANAAGWFLVVVQDA